MPLLGSKRILFFIPQRRTIAEIELDSFPFNFLIFLDEELFYAFGISEDENYLVLEGIKKDPKDENLNNHRLYVYKADIDGKLNLISTKKKDPGLSFDSHSADYNFMIDIFVRVKNSSKGKASYTISGVSSSTKELRTFELKDDQVTILEEGVKIKDAAGDLKCAKFFEKGFYCLGGDEFIHYIEEKEVKSQGGGSRASDSGGGGKGGATKGGATKGLNVGIRRKKRRGFL